MLLLTGANGFLGRNLIEELSRRNYQIRAFVGPGENLYDFYDKVAEISRGDILDREYRAGCYGLDYFDSKHEAQLLVLQAVARGDLPGVRGVEITHR
jgi:nucleoside-diphosphate-sugar epimerase